eukprot:875374_1
MCESKDSSTVDLCKETRKAYPSNLNSTYHYDQSYFMASYNKMMDMYDPSQYSHDTPFAIHYSSLFFNGYAYENDMSRHTFVPVDIQSIVCNYLDPDRNYTSFIYQNISNIVQHYSSLSLTTIDIFMILNQYHDATDQLIHDLCNGLSTPNLHGGLLTQQLVAYTSCNQRQRQLLCDILLHKSYFIDLQQLNVSQMTSALISVFNDVCDSDPDVFHRILMQNDIDGKKFYSLDALSFEKLFKNCSSYSDTIDYQNIYHEECLKWSNQEANPLVETFEMNGSVRTKKTVAIALGTPYKKRLKHTVRHSNVARIKIKDI